MDLSSLVNLEALGRHLEPVLGDLKGYSSWLMPLAACFVFGLVAPLVTSVLRLALQLTVQIIRAPLMWIRGISNELAIVIYRHGPGFTRVIARPLAVAVIVAVGYAVSTQLQWKGGAPAAPSTLTASTAAPDCSGDIIPLNCPRKR